ncbi:MAG: tetratricopeptide repeat protein [Gammaproteobacteria bacterium]|nr:tetratricopeptide repeat protein [Gammaproteobacteria bacterium]
MSSLFFCRKKKNTRSINLFDFIRVIFFLFFFFFSFNASAETPTIKKLLDESVGLLMKQESDGAIHKLDQVLLLSPKHPEAYFRKGQALMQKREAKKGLELVIESTRVAPENVRYSLYLARIYSKQGQIDKAMEEYQRVIDTGTRDLRIKVVEKLLSLATGRSLVMKNEINAALLIFNGLLLEYPDDPQVLFNIGNVYMQLNRIEEGERIFAKLHKIGPKNPIVNMNLAKIYEKTNRPKLAMTHLKLIMDLKLNDEASKNATVQYYIIQGRLELGNRQWEAALKSLQKVVTIDPKRTEAFFNISMANLQLGNTLLAERGFLTVLKVTPEDYSARLNLGQMYFDIGKTEQAKEQFQYIIDKDKSQRYSHEAKKRMNLLHSLIADKALKSGNIDMGLIEYEKALSYSSANTKASFTRGMIFIEQKKYPEARIEFESVIAYSPKNIQARVNLGKIYEIMSLFSKAAEQYEILMELDKNGKAGRFAAARWKITKGRGLWAEKKLPESEKIFEEVTKEQPNNFQAFAFLGILQSSRGMLREAAISFQHVLDLRPTNYAIKIMLGKVYEQLGLDSLAANEYRSIVFAGGKIPQVPEAEQRLAAVEARLSGFSNTITYSFNYDSNLALNDADPFEEVTSNIALSFNYAMKARDDLSFSVNWSPTYSAYHFNQTDYLISVLRSNVSFGSPDDRWSVGFNRQGQSSLVNDRSLNKVTAMTVGRSKKSFAKPAFNLAPLGFEGESIATNVGINGGLRHMSSFTGVGLESIMATLSLSLSQQLRWGVVTNASYSLGIFRNLKSAQLSGGRSTVKIDDISGLEVTEIADTTLIYSSDDYEFNSHTGSLSFSKTLAPGVIGNLAASGTFTQYVNPDSGADTRGDVAKRLNLGLSISPSITYMFFKEIRFVLSGTAQKNLSSLPVGLSAGRLESDNEDVVGEAIATIQSTSLGNYTRFSVEASFIMNF